MRIAAPSLLLWMLACGSASSPIVSVSTGAPDDGGTVAPAPMGSAPDAGTAADAGGSTTGDAGNSADAGAPPDAGAALPPPPKLETRACLGPPAVVWSRTFSVDVDFDGAVDEEGNVYWVEYDPPRTIRNPDPPAFLASADSGGNDRYRVPLAVAPPYGGLMIVGNRVVTSNGRALLAGYDTASGKQSWSIDLRGTYKDANAEIHGIADLGNGKLAFAVFDENVASGLYIADTASGAILWSTVGNADARYRVVASDGAGTVLAGSHVSADGYFTALDLFVLDSSGHQGWNHRVTDSRSVLSWFSSGPWLPIFDTQALSGPGDYVPVPWRWFSAVEGAEGGFALESSGTALTPIAVNVIRGGTVVAQGQIEGTISFNPVAAWPFLAGATGDHLVLVSQSWHGNPGLCWPTAPGAAALSRYDADSSSQCPFKFEGTTAILGAALLDGRLILGRRSLSLGCGDHLNPVTIETYDLPGESLAPSGWVQSGGSPGLGMRPLRR